MIILRYRRLPEAELVIDKTEEHMQELGCNVNETELYDLAELFKIFGDSTRIRILFTLFNNDEVSVGELAESLNMTISAISHQLRILKHNKLVKSHREGKLSLYSLDDEHVRTIIGCGMEHIEER